MNANTAPLRHRDEGGAMNILIVVLDAVLPPEVPDADVLSSRRH